MDLEFIRDIELVGIKEEEDEVRAFRKPPTDVGEIIPTRHRLFVPSQHARRVHHVDVFQDLRRTNRALKAIQERHTKTVEAAKGHVTSHGQGIAWME